MPGGAQRVRDVAPRVERGCGELPDVEGGDIEPVAVLFGHVLHIEAATLHEADGQGTRHLRVVCDLAGLQPERAATDHLAMRTGCEQGKRWRIQGAKLERGTEGVAHSQSEDSPSCTIDIHLGSFDDTRAPHCWDRKLTAQAQSKTAITAPSEAAGQLRTARLR